MRRQAGLVWAASLVLAIVLTGSGPISITAAAGGRAAAPAAPTSPEKFFGFRMGTDRKLARWDRVVEYFRLLARESNRIQVVDMGPSTEGNPFLLAFITLAEEPRPAGPPARHQRAAQRPARARRDRRSTRWWPRAGRSSSCR